MRRTRRSRWRGWAGSPPPWREGPPQRTPPPFATCARSSCRARSARCTSWRSPPPSPSSSPPPASCSRRCSAAARSRAASGEPSPTRTRETASGCSTSPRARTPPSRAPAWPLPCSAPSSASSRRAGSRAGSSSRCLARACTLASLACAPPPTRSRCTPSSSSSCSSRLPAAASTRKARRLGHRSRGARTTPRRSSRSRRSCSPFTPSRAARCTPASPSRRCCASRARAWRRCTRLTRRSKRYTTAVRRLATAFSWRFSSAALPRYFRTQSAWRGCSRARHRQHRSCRGALPPPQPSGLSPPPEGPVRASRRGECCWRGREGATPRRQRARRWPEASQSGATWSRASARAAR
mmetsp:Transcript_43753/g.142360  ORF Transcript_43753/g.142360 Transcript_43753/m.142360 type:complete len:352 (+) Transcript_43753:851-1906(+)